MTFYPEHDRTFNNRIQHVPMEWRGPLVDVLDTADYVHTRLACWGMESDSSALVSLTALVMEEHHRQRLLQHQQEMEEDSEP